MADDYQMSYKQRQHLRHGSISQTTQIFYGVQGETPRRLQDALVTRRYHLVPDQHWVRAGAIPPSWSYGGRPGRFKGDPDVCPECGDDYERRWHGSDGTIGYDHGGYCETGPICRMEANDE